VQEGGDFDYYANQFAPDVFNTGGGGGISPDVKTAIDNAYAAGDYSTVNNIVANNNITAADVADTYKGFDTSGLAGLGINLFTPDAASGAGANYFAQNQDVANAYADNSYGMTQDEFAQAHFNNFGQNEGRTLGAGSNSGLTALTNTVNTTGVDTGVDTGGGGITNLAAAAAAPAPYYFQVNPDVAAEYARNPMGLTPEQFAQAHYENFGKKEGREFEMSAGAAYAKANNMDLVGNTLKWIDDNPFATPEQITAAIKGSGMSIGDANRALDSLVASGKITEAERYFIQQGKGVSGMA
jgi:hypothetical protein